MTTWQHVKNALTCLLLISLIFLSAAVTKTMLEVQVTTVEARKRLVDTSQNLNGVLVQVGLAADELQQMARAQKTSNEEHNKRLSALVDESRNLVKGLDFSVNYQLIPEATGALRATERNLNKIGDASAESITETTVQLNRNLEELHSLLQQANARLNDPRISVILDQIEASSKRLPAITANAETISANAAKSSEHIERSLRPAKFLLAIGKAALQAGYQLKSLIF